MQNEKMKSSHYESCQSCATSPKAKCGQSKNSELTSRAVIGQYSGLGPNTAIPGIQNNAVSDTITSKMSQAHWSAVESEKNGTGRAFGD